MAIKVRPRSSDAKQMVDDSGSENCTRGLSHGLSAHILPTSSTMIGVCMTVLSIGHLGPAAYWRMVDDKLLAIDALVFLASALLSFMSMRSLRFSVRFEVSAEFMFIAGLGLLAIGALVLAFGIT